MNLFPDQGSVEVQHQTTTPLSSAAMDRALCIATFWLCVVACCQCEKITLDQKTVPEENKCGVVTCKVDIDIATSSKTDKDSSISFKSISRMSLFMRDATDLFDKARGQRDSFLGSVSTQAPQVATFSNDKNVFGKIESRQSSIKVELFKQQDCLSQFICRVIGQDYKGREVLSTYNLAQQKSQIYGGGLIFALKFDDPHLRNSPEKRIEDKIESFERRMERKIMSVKSQMEESIQELKNDLTARSGVLNDEAKEKAVKQLDRDFDERLKDMIGQLQINLTSNRIMIASKFEEMKTHLQTGLRFTRKKFRGQLLKKIGASERRLKGTIQKDSCKKLKHIQANLSRAIQGEQTQALEDVFQRFELTLNKTTDVLTSMKRDLELLKSYVEENSISVKNTSDAARDMSRDAMPKCMLANSTDYKNEPISCYRGMASDMDKDSPKYVEMTLCDPKRKILCDTRTDEGGWILIQRRGNSDISFKRPYEDYGEGFGLPPDDFWLGNELLHKLTSENLYELRIDMWSSEGNPPLYAEYSNFSIESRRWGYRLNLGSYSGTVGEVSTDYGLSYNHKHPFTTYDFRRSPIQTSCSHLSTDGWWHDVCNEVNLNGLIGNTVLWWNTGTRNITFKRAEMKIRRI
ncbi:tenascin [Elysia marginata]|uniref:Tenascin n=1 Tax=Elysia marginata TaxID=1093978 RepID=A0AAV4FUU5_9GAST|nr:tenascin [Elysia marginata]